MVFRESWTHHHGSETGTCSLYKIRGKLLNSAYIYHYNSTFCLYLLCILICFVRIVQMHVIILVVPIQASPQTINEAAKLCFFELHLWTNLCICTYLNSWKMGANRFKSLILIPSLWPVRDVFTCKLCCDQHSFSVLLLWWNANIWEPEQSNLLWTYILSPLLPCWPEPCLGVYALDVNSMTPGWRRAMCRPFHVVLFDLQPPSPSRGLVLGLVYQDKRSWKSMWE